MQHFTAPLDFNMKKIFKYLVNLIYPNKCIFCQRVTEIGKDIFICDNCREKTLFCKDAECCKICGKPQMSLGEKGKCYTCLTKTYRAYKKATAVVKYDAVTARGIRRYKDGNNPNAGTIFAHLMAEQMTRELANVKFDCIVGVAPNRKRALKRGIDPVDILCENLSRITGVPYKKNTLKRIKEVPKQSSLNYNDRMRNMIGAVGLTKTADVSGKTVLLIDDIMTTGATVSECAYILKEGGAKGVYILTFATVVKEPKTYVNTKK